MLIRSVIEKCQLKHMVKYLCEVAGVSRSGYYSYFSMKSQKQRKQKDKKDEIVKDITNEGYERRDGSFVLKACNKRENRPFVLEICESA